MSTHYQRTVRFAEVDGAGFVFFAKYLELCHEAYEASLLRSGIELRTCLSKHKKRFVSQDLFGLSLSSQLCAMSFVLWV